MAFLDEHAGELCEECLERRDTNPLRVFDCKNASLPGGARRRAQDHRPSLRRRAASTSPRCARYLDARGVAYAITPALVRGLDYYTRTAWEFVTGQLGAQGTIGGGGRYDGLAEQLGGPPTPGVGVRRRASSGCSSSARPQPRAAAELGVLRGHAPSPPGRGCSR